MTKKRKRGHQVRAVNPGIHKRSNNPVTTVPETGYAQANPAQEGTEKLPVDIRRLKAKLLK